MIRFWVPGLPFILSLCLSLCTVGSTVYWQDSGFFLTGIRELGVLYPPGFVLYLILCKSWTLLVGFLDFTLAVHLFSSICAAFASAVLALAARDLLRTQGPLCRVSGTGNDAAAALAGCLAASGFTFWSAALLAKGYALLYLVLALALWRMIRADESGKGRDFTIVAALIGLAWAVHPSATDLGFAFGLFVAAHRKSLGWKGIAGRSGVAAACALGPSLLLPLLAARGTQTVFGHPVSIGEWFRFLRGDRFTGLPGVFGFESFRVEQAFRYLWEDLLGVGLALAAFGLFRIARANRRLLLGILAWMIPAALIATLFRIEGQQDFWLAAAWLPLYLAVAVGLQAIPGPRARIVVAALGGLALGWAILANGPAVTMRGYTLADSYGRFHLEPVEPGAILLLSSDDALATTQYLQIVKHVREDVLIVNASRLDPSGWYGDHLKRRTPSLIPQDSPAAFANANVAARPVYFESAPPDSQVKAGYVLVPAGPYLKLVPRDKEGDPPAWETSIKMDEVRRRFGRPRGIRLHLEPDRLEVAPEPYEQRWITAFVRARSQAGQVYFKRGGADNLRQAIELYEEALAADPHGATLSVLQPLAASYYLTGNPARAEPLLKRVLQLSPPPRIWVQASYFLSRICQSQGRTAEEERYRLQAISAVGADPELRREFEQFSKPR